MSDLLAFVLKPIGFLSCFPFRMWEIIVDTEREHHIERTWLERLAVLLVMLPAFWVAFSEGYDEGYEK